MLKLLEAHDIPFELLFVEQSSDGLFNRAALLNAGYTLLDQTRLESSIPLENQRVCFHDIDYVPRNAMAFAPYVQSATYQLASRSTCKPEPAAWVASRVICMQRPVVDRVNGWATDYWGWGFEDADFDLRLLYAGESVQRVNSTVPTHQCIGAEQERALQKNSSASKALTTRMNIGLYCFRKNTFREQSFSADVAGVRQQRSRLMKFSVLQDTREARGPPAIHGRGGRVSHALISLVDDLHPALVESMSAVASSISRRPPPQIQLALQRCLRSLGGCGIRPHQPEINAFLDSAARRFSVSRNLSWKGLRVPASLRKDPATRFCSHPNRAMGQPRVFITGLVRAATDWVALMASLPMVKQMGAAHNMSIEDVLRRKYFISCRPACIREPFNPHTRTLTELCDQANRVPKSRDMRLSASPFHSQYLVIDESSELTFGRWMDHVLQLCMEERRIQDGISLADQGLVMKDANGFFAAEWVAARYRMKVMVLVRSPFAWLASMKSAGWDQLDGCNRKSIPDCKRDVLLEQLIRMASKSSAGDQLRLPHRISSLLQRAKKWGSTARNAVFLLAFFHSCVGYRARFPHWRFIRQEDALARSDIFITELYDFIGIPWATADHEVMQVARASTHSNEGHTRHSSRRVFGSQPTAWQTVLTTTERNMAANLTRDASAPWYADDHWWKIPARGTRFQDKIEPSGLPPQSTSFGVSFGDFNNDTLPDIFMGFHYTGLRHEHQVFEKPAVYVNMGGGQPTFRKLSLTDMPGVATKVEHDCNSTCYVLHRSGDLHGATWHDFDGDGDQDIFINTGGQGGMGSSPCLFLVNEGGAFTDKAFQFNLSLNELRGRVSLFFDWNGDGLSDLLVTAQPGGRGVAGRSVVYQQQREAYRVDVARLPLHRAAHPLERPAELRARAADGEGECLDPLAVAK